MAKKTVSRKTRVQVDENAGELEVEEVVEVKPAKPPAGIETWLIMVTWAALLAALVLINIKMRGTFGEGWPI